ncbi:MAG: hypothetical protein A2W85_09915 [Bacteroidetes bacterium GWF2_41_31]|nr:MAG: hypothetical protein A2W85_09915 [Bacteroidetes bacterium GWF2_41_31]
MKSKTYLIRLDDACPTMNRVKWSNIETILDRYNIKPMVGIVASNEDFKLKFTDEDPGFWIKARNWQAKGWSLALHGYEHLYHTNSGGVNPMHNRSEFAGLSLEEQESKIENGIAILNNNGLFPKYFFAPSHTFDENTIKALKSKSNIRIISDTIAFKPYYQDGITFIPQQFGSFRKIKISGVWTFCLHPNNMTNNNIYQFEKFINQNTDLFSSFDEVDIQNISSLLFVDKLLRYFYFRLREIKLLLNLGK